MDKVGGGKLRKNEDSGTDSSPEYPVPLSAVPIDLARNEPLSTGRAGCYSVVCISL